MLQAVWADAAGHVGAYQPPSGGTPETVAGAPDWRGLLDLLEAESGNRFDDLWRTWVARDEDLPLLDARAAARTRYDQVVGDAGDWTLPKPIRDAMRAWRFDDATRMLDEAERGPRPARHDRDERRGGRPDAVAGAGDGVRGRRRLRRRHGRSRRRGHRDRRAIATPSPRDRPAPTRSPTLGLWGADPEATLAAARTAFEAGDLVGSAHAAEAAEATWTGATSIGQGRAISIAMLLAAILLAVILAIAWRPRADRRRRRSRMQAHRIKS